MILALLILLAAPQAPPPLADLLTRARDPIEAGDEVRVALAYPPGHIRTPHFLRGKKGVVLRDFGAEIYVVELVSIAFLREFAVLMTAIVLAGRTASAFTAQIGAMKSREEIDAIRTLGLDPIDLLVIPRLLALLVMLPLLTFISMMAGLAGGVTVGAFDLDIPPQMYIARMHDTIEVRHFLVGLSKAPVFALVIGLIGCLEGLRVEGTAQSVGERTTSSVVQAISLVIMIDALAALWFMHMDW